MSAWKPSVTYANERRQRWTRNGTKTYVARGLRGVARRIADGHEQYERCDHVHVKRGPAMACAEQLARHLNETSS